MMKCFFYTCILFLATLIASTNANCQNSSSPGFVVTLTGDTLYGSIELKQSDINPVKITFISSDKSEPKHYHPLEIKAFGVNDKNYVGAIVQTEISPRSTNELNDFAALQLVADTVFLQRLVQGEKSLFTATNKYGNQNFYIDQNEGFELLIYKKYLFIENGQGRLSQNNRFVGQLINYLGDCPGIQQKSAGLIYQPTSLIKLFHRYYECIGDQAVFHKMRSGLQTNFGFIGGASMTTIAFKGEGLDYLTKVDYEGSVNPTMGLFLEVFLPRKQGKWSVYNELNINTLQASGNFEDVVHENRYTLYETEIECTYLTMSNMIRLWMPLRKSRLFFNAGISNGYAVGNTNKVRTISKFFDTTRIEEKEAIEGIRKFETALLAGAGISYKHFSFETRAAFGNGMSPFSGLKSNTSRIILLLAYGF
ncbi:MAG: porin family protein [Bacteroidetes bacterium]|jgi:hypothetical protein|nr:porin family protein [Bacteroidota bacterium]